MLKNSYTKRFPLERRVSFRLQRIGTLLTTQVVSLLKQSGGLTLNQWRILSFLNERKSGSAYELAKMGHIDKATMSRAAAELEKKGLISSQVSASDRRLSVLKLTEEGGQMIERIEPLMAQRQAELIGAISEDDRESLFRILDELEKSIKTSRWQST